MGLETFIGTYIDGLNTSNPVGTDGKNTADDHLRGIKLVLQNTFPNVSGAITATHTELNILDTCVCTADDLNILAGMAVAGVTGTEFSYLNGVTSAIQTQFSGKASTGANSDITSLSALSTPLSVAQGGTGTTALNAYHVLVGNGTGAVTKVSPGTAGKVLMSNGTGADPSFQTREACIGSCRIDSSGTVTRQSDGPITFSASWATNVCTVTLTGNTSWGSDYTPVVSILDGATGNLVYGAHIRSASSTTIVVQTGSSSSGYSATAYGFSLQLMA